MNRDSLEVLDLRAGDDVAVLRRRLAMAQADHVALVIPWDLRFLSRELDYDLLRREAQRHRLNVAIVSPDPERRQLASDCGFPTFINVEDAAAKQGRWNGREPEPVKPPPTHWWEEESDALQRLERAAPKWLQWVGQRMRSAAFVMAIAVLVTSAYVIVPSAEINVVPAGETMTLTVPVSVDPEVKKVTYLEDGTGGIVPSRRVGLEVEGRSEVATTETATVASGRATGEVLLTSLLSQDYLVPSGTIVRTSSTSYPIRFRTTADVLVPAGGQARVAIEALDERTGNVGAFQINRVEGVAASAVRVTNPEPTTGAEGKEVPVVVQEDYDRVREQLTGELLDKAYGGLQGLLEPNEFLPYQSLRVESVPKKAYSHFIGEQAETVGLNMRLLVSGQAVHADDVRDVARQALVEGTPAGYHLIDAHFELGEVNDQPEGPGWFSVDVKARGYAAAAVGEGTVLAKVRGKPVPDARATLEQAFPLAEPPEVKIWPAWPEWLSWLERVPIVPLRIEVHVTPDAPDLTEDTALLLSVGTSPSG